MKTVKPTNGMVITEDIRLEPGVYCLPDGLSFGGDDITLDGNGAHLVGSDHQGIGIQIDGLQNLTVKNLQISGYRFGIEGQNCQHLTIKHCRVFDTALPSHRHDENPCWVTLEKLTGSAILFAGVRDGQVTNNDLQHQANGLCAYSCQGLTVEGNNASHNIKFGYYLFDTTGSQFHRNIADHCSLNIEKSASTGIDEVRSAGFALINNTSNNHFTQNSARFCDIGFLILGISPDHDLLSCMDNRFEQNESEFCSASAFYDSFNQRNVFTGNIAGQSGYGFLARYVDHVEFRENKIIGNHRAGIAAGNSIHCEGRYNTIQDNPAAVLLWSEPNTAHVQVLPDNDTSKFWVLESNTIHRNGTGIRIAANPDVGQISPNKIPNNATQVLKPHDHEIYQNVISENRVGIQTVNAERTMIKDNQFELNLKGDIKS